MGRIRLIAERFADAPDDDHAHRDERRGDAAVSPGDAEFVEVVVSMVASTAAVATILVLDERRLRGAQCQRAWPAVSRDAAIFGAWNFGALYGCLVLIVHFTRTRASAVGLALGIAASVALLAVAVGSTLLAAAIIDWAGV
jgi:hypothetical protein